MPTPSHALHDQQQQRDAQHGRGQHLDHRRGVERPEEQRHAKPGHSRRPQGVDRDDEVEPGENRAEAEDERAQQGRHDGRLRRRAVGRVEGPAGVEAAE